MSNAADLSWFIHDRFGLFVHFGLYALPGRHEWVMTREKRTAEDYERYAQYFDPDQFDAPALAKLAKQAGMKYAVLTSKHHEGFCMWDTAETDYNSMKACGRDLVREFCDAMRAEGLRVGLYHSLLDWHHPQFTIDPIHPLRDEDRKEINKSRDMAEYRRYLHAQIRELLTDYGRIDYLFYDFTFMAGGEDHHTAEDWDAEGLMALTRELQPGIIVNDRLGIPGDLVTPEEYQPNAPMRDMAGELANWEACLTMNGSWGYDRDNVDYRTPHQLISLLVDCVSKNGNVLLNVGPDGRGGIRAEDSETLVAIGEWMRLHERSVVGAGPSDVQAPLGTVVTQRGNRLYFHFLAWPLKHIHVPDLGGRVEYAQMLNDASEVTFVEADPDAKSWNVDIGGLAAGTVTFDLPVRAPRVAVPVLEVILKD